ncbi:MAG: hypothetical protein DI564_08465 [Rhodanobacter denitrificans]|uniref:Uncharacterized protein n=1 Tax=Rhodanobacter denitrificans TaxID=666685 RepID=A0A2W5MD50_9GAMM|nr:MAG: hypothetical protein DI564_08465 [Rhodanobacter denitrificans]
MDTRQVDHDLSTAPALGRWLLLALLAAIGCGYLAAFAFFVGHSEDFVERQIDERVAREVCTQRSALPLQLMLGEGSADLARLGSGWHAPEASGIWTRDEDASLILHVPTERDLTLDVELRSFVARRHPQVDVELLANGTPLARWETRPGHDRVDERVRLPRAALGDGCVKLTFRVDSPASPLSKRAGPDMRRLGVFVSRLTLAPAEAS